MGADALDLALGGREFCMMVVRDEVPVIRKLCDGWEVLGSNRNAGAYHPQSRVHKSHDFDSVC